MGDDNKCGANNYKLTLHLQIHTCSLQVQVQVHMCIGK